MVVVGGWMMVLVASKTCGSDSVRIVGLLVVGLVGVRTGRTGRGAAAAVAVGSSKGIGEVGMAMDRPVCKGCWYFSCCCSCCCRCVRSASKNSFPLIICPCIFCWNLKGMSDISVTVSCVCSCESRSLLASSLGSLGLLCVCLAVCVCSAYPRSCFINDPSPPPPPPLPPPPLPAPPQH